MPILLICKYTYENESYWSDENERNGKHNKINYVPIFNGQSSFGNRSSAYYKVLFH